MILFGYPISALAATKSSRRGPLNKIKVAQAGSLRHMNQDLPAIGIIGGSGLYQMEGVENPTEQRVETAFGDPSDAIIGGQVQGRQVYFLPRHGRGHRLLPHELNHHANIYALRSLNVRWIICVTAVGSLQEKYAPRRFAAFTILRSHEAAR